MIKFSFWGIILYGLCVIGGWELFNYLVEHIHIFWD